MVRLPDPWDSRAYLVGVSQYAQATALPPLPAVNNNLEGLYTVLTRADRGGFMPDHCVVSPQPASLGEIARTRCPAAAIRAQAASTAQVSVLARLYGPRRQAVSVIRIGEAAIRERG